MISLLLLLGVSCSSPQREERRILSFSELLGRICMKGEGRGKLKSLGKTYTFNHELAIDGDGFLLGVDFPFYREEFLKIDFKRGRRGIDGSLYKRMLKHFDGEPQLRKGIEDSLSSLGHLLASIQICRNGLRGRECFSNRLDDRWRWKDNLKKGHLSFSYFPHKGKSRAMVFARFKVRDGYLNRQKIDIHLSEGEIVMEFFINSCSGI